MVQKARCKLTLKIMMQYYNLENCIIFFLTFIWIFSFLFLLVLCWMHFFLLFLTFHVADIHFLRAVAAKCILHPFETALVLTWEQTAVKFVRLCDLCFLSSKTIQTLKLNNWLKQFASENDNKQKKMFAFSLVLTNKSKPVSRKLKLSGHLFFLFSNITVIIIINFKQCFLS